VAAAPAEAQAPHLTQAQRIKIMSPKAYAAMKVESGGQPLTISPQGLLELLNSCHLPGAITSFPSSQKTRRSKLMLAFGIFTSAMALPAMPGPFGKSKQDPIYTEVGIDES
jgi:hypothetical protein